ncbi:MAG: cyclopropane-fatty-acyl-phospholipid synthase [Anaerolineales bacterium]|jgi:cyclopropane-fatty-acyl-phospholipid synthase
MTTKDGPSLARTSQRDSAAEITKEILHSLFKGVVGRGVGFRLWDGQTLYEEAGVETRATIVLNHPGALRRMFLPPGELSLGEAYLRGDFDIQGDIFAAIELSGALENLALADLLGIVWKTLRLPKSAPSQAYLEGRQRAHLQGTPHSRQRDRDAVTYHYDTGNAFYRLFLGQWMAYSCAYFHSAQTDLDSAQEAKLEHICRKLRLQPGERLLDIGCGWGGLVVYAAEHYGVDALGITLSEPQVAYANDWIEQKGLSGRARVEVRDYRDLATYKAFDKIVSVGMFEHVGRRKQMEYFQCAFQALQEGGLFLNHGIATQTLRSPSWLERTLLQQGQFTDRYVFPDGELIPVSEALVFAEQAGFEVRDVEGLREHYALTLHNWVQNLEAQHGEAVRLTDERTYRTWRLYMAASATGFERGNISVFQVLLSKSTHGRAELPLTREDLYLLDR